MESPAEETKEMEMRATEEIEMGQDISPPLHPLGFALYDSFLSSHCCVCFSSLPSPLPQSPPSPYCSVACSLSDSDVGSPQPPLDITPLLSSDVRASIRLLISVSTTATSAASSPLRICSLLTNHRRLMADPSISAEIRRGAAGARRSRGDCSDADDTVLEESALCAVMTNAVEVQDNTGRGLGIAVYDGRFSWINHSCSPNACYRFVISSPETASFQEDPGGPKMVPSIMNTETVNGDDDVCRNAEHWEGTTWQYGPKLIVRSIKRIKRGEKITVSYIDLLQPKTLRQSDLWSKYRFLCSCERCTVAAPAYADSILEGVLSLEPEETTVAHHETAYKDEAAREMSDHIEETIDDLLSDHIDPETCCEEIENVLNRGIRISHSQRAKETKPQPHFRLHPLHHIALNAYITLASAYKVRSTELVATDSETDKAKQKAFDMRRISAAYCLFLAGANHHLFNSEPSLILSAANFWTNAGESLLALAFNPQWPSPVSSLPSIPELKYAKCSLTRTFEDPKRHRDLNASSAKFLRCITEIAGDTWSFLAQGCPYLLMFRSPVDFSFLEMRVSEWSSCDMDGDAELHSGKRVSILRLGVHCLVYAALLADLCYGHDSYLVSHIHNLLSRHEIS